jgi:hypothetical protein
MINQRNSQISLATLILCLLLGSLVILPFLQINPSTSEIFGLEAENFGLFDHAEFDDDFLVKSIVDVKITQPNYLESRPANLGYLSASLSPVSPPPKHS